MEKLLYKAIIIQGILLNAKLIAFDVPNANYIGSVKSLDLVRDSLHAYVEQDAQIIPLDGNYTSIKHESFILFNKWYRSKIKRLNPPKNGENFDCEDFALLYKSLFSLAFLNEKRERQGLVGVIVVNQRNKALGIPATGAHALNIILTEKGWWVYEPQTGEFCKLSRYPNKIIAYII